MGKIIEKVDYMCINAKNRLHNFVYDLTHDEDGMEVVQVIVLLAVGLAIVAAVAVAVRRMTGTATEEAENSLNQALGK